MSNKVIITMGDPAGIGPLITVKALMELGLSRQAVTIIGDSRILNSIKGYSLLKKHVNLVDLNNTKNIKTGIPSKLSGRASLDYLNQAVKLIKSGNKSILITAPVSKEAIQSVKRGFSGHTEFLAESFLCESVCMMMVGRSLRVAFLTRHILIRDIQKNLFLQDIEATLRLSVQSLKRLFQIKHPRVGLCSLNPHAGIDTFLEKEEKMLIKAVDKLKDKRTQFIGPYPSDTLFRKAKDESFDAVVVFYHDQGMIPFKTLEFSCGVNLTLGLGFIRTSPAHGPAFNLVNNENAVDYRPMKEAIKLAIKLSN